MRKVSILVVVLLLSFFFARSVNAQRLINIDFGAHTNPAFSVKTGRAATGFSDTDFWNLYSRDGAGGSFLNDSELLNLKLSDGTITDADLFVRNAPGAWYTLNSDPMFQSYLYPGGGNIEIILTNVPSGTYDIYVYAHGQPPAENSVIQLQSGGVSFPAKSTSAALDWDSHGWREGNQYVVFRSVAVQPSTTLFIASTPGAAGMSVINGIQLLEGVNPRITITQQPVDQNVPLSGTAEFSVTANSELPISFQWLLNGSPIPGANNPVLQINNATAANAGAYRVVVSNAFQTAVSSSAFLRVFLPVSEQLMNIDFGAHLNPFLHRKTGPAAIGKGASDQWNLYSRDGQNGEFLDNNELENMVWSDGSPSSAGITVTNAAGAFWTAHSDAMFESYLYPGSHSGNITATLTSLPAGIYDVYVYAHGQPPSENALVELSTDSTAHGTRNTSSASDWNTLNWTEGNHYVLFRDVRIIDGERLRIISKPGDSETAVINGMQLLRKQSAPTPSDITIVRAPQDQFVPLGGSTEFSVEATSGLPLAYQWFLNGEAIAGANGATLNISSAAARDAGTYLVRINNALRNVSAAARLDTFTPTDRPLLNIDFGAHENPFFSLKTGPAAVGKAAEDQWNLYSRDDGQGGWRADGQLANLVWSDGTSSAIQLVVSNAAGAFFTLNEDPMFHSYLYPLSRLGNVETLLTGLPPGRYDVYVYAHGQIPEENGVIALRTGFSNYGVKTNSSAANWDQNGWNEGGEYVVFSNVQIGLGEGLRITARAGQSGLAVINGVQLVLRDGNPRQFNPTVADWTFEEGVASAQVTGAQDYSGNQHHITQVLGSTLPFTFVRSGAEVNGTISVGFPPGNGGFGAALRANDSVDFNLGSEFTLEVSVNPGAFNTEWNRGILVGQDAASGRLTYGLDYRSESRVVNFVIADSQGQMAAVQATVPNDGGSHHLAGVFSGGVLRIYLDKQLVESEATTVLPGFAPGGAGRVTLGANDIGGFWFTGAIDRARISREALAPDEFFATTPDDPVNPLVILQPLEQVTVAEGGSATFHVVASGGTNALSYRWMFNGQVLSNQTSDMLVLNNVRLVDAGTYTVTVASGPWEVSSSANLTVTTAGAGAPVITAHPQSRLAGAGFAAQFSVSATSSTPLSYQWFFNGAPVPGETNSTLWVVDVAAENAGTYYVSVRNASGSTVSQPAILNVFSTGITGGTVYLDNNRPGVNVPITDDRGVRVSGPEFLAQLHGGPLGGTIAPAGAAIPFGTGENAGYFSDPIERVIPGTTPGAQAHFEVRVWDSRAGATYEAAAANGGLHGSSAPIFDAVGGGVMLPATLRLMQPFSLAALPTITGQPGDLAVREGRTALFEVSATGTGPLTYQWKFNNAALAGRTSATLVLSNVADFNAGSYSVDVRNAIGVVTSRVARLTVVPRDSQGPVITLTSPTNSTSTDPRVTLAGRITDNVGVTRVEWHRNGQFIAPITLDTNGAFSIPNIVLTPGTNQFTVTAYDEDENGTTRFISVTFEAGRAIWVDTVPAVQEGAPVAVPILLNSAGDIGAISFSLAYDTNYLAQPNLTWRSLDGNAFTQVNTDQPGIIRGTYVLPGRTIRSGTNDLALVSFRTRSVPESLNTPLTLEVQGVYSASGDPLASGTGVGSGEVRILRRDIIGDNNANDRLDVGDASAIIRLLTLLDPVRAWDVSGNDLNQNAVLDPGDAVRVLRAVVNLDPQPRVPGAAAFRQQGSFDERLEPPLLSLMTLSAETNRLAAGEKIKVSLNLLIPSPIYGVSFRLNYPTNALRLENSEAHTVAAGFPGSAMILWNLAPNADYTSQTGELSFAAGAAAPWQATSLTEFTFTVQPGADSQRFWPVTISQGEIATGGDVAALQPFELLLEGRDAALANLTVGSFNTATGAFELRLAGDPGTTYRIESSEDLRAWTPVSTITAGLGPIRVSDSPANPVRSRFYRAVEVP